MIVAGIATMPERLPYLEGVVNAIRPQVDVLRVYLNNFDEVPGFLAPDEGCLSEDAAGDLGAEGKFYWVDDHEKHNFTHYLTVDDDLGYPPDYVARLVEEFEARDRRAIVGVHGSEFEDPIQDFVTSRKARYRFYEPLEDARCVHLLGTATTMLSKETISLSMDDFSLRNTTDLQLAITAQEQAVPMIVVPRSKDWVKEVRPWTAEGFSIWKSTKTEGHSQLKTRLAQTAIKQWQLHPDPLGEPEKKELSGSLAQKIIGAALIDTEISGATLATELE